MHDCFGLSFLGLCAYDPSEPASIYFSIGDAVAAMGIALIIPEFLRPIYTFRLKTRIISLNIIYYIVFSAFIFVVIASIIPNLDISNRNTFGYPLFWEIAGGTLFFVALCALAFAYLRPSSIRLGRYRRFAHEAAEFLAHANERDRVAFSEDLEHNIDRLIKTARFNDFPRERSAFFDFRYRQQIEDASYASSLLQLVSDHQFCATLVDRCPWVVARILHKAAEAGVPTRSIENFVQELGRQAIISPKSMMAREIDYKGFRSAPVLTEGLFSDWFLNVHYQPLRGLRYQDFRIPSSDTIDRLNSAAEASLKVIFRSRDYWMDRSLQGVDSFYEASARYAHSQARSGSKDYETDAKIHFGLLELIRMTNKHLSEMDVNEKKKLYVRDEEQIDHVYFLNDVAECIYQVLCVFSNDFEGHNDPFWGTSVGLMQEAFPKFSKQPEGMNPLQQRLAIKIRNKIRDNMEGYYPALTRLLLPVIGSYEHPAVPENNSAFAILKSAFYSELKKFPDLSGSKPEKSKDYLPANFLYDAEKKTFIQLYRLGESDSTDLSALSIDPISLTADAILSE